MVDHVPDAAPPLRFRYTKPQSFSDCVGNELPLGWEEAYDNNIGVYYVNHVTSECRTAADVRESRGPVSPRRSVGGRSVWVGRRAVGRLGGTPRGGPFDCW